MPLTVLSGVASHVSMGSEIGYVPTAQYGPMPVKNQLVSLRIDNRPVLFRTRQLPSISDGDRVAFAGSVKGGTLEALAMRNLTTGASYHLPTTPLMIIAVISIVFGIPLILVIGIGLFFIGIGVWMFLKARNIGRAQAMVDAEGAAPAMQPVAR
jgi:hypothetical protein